MKCKQCERQIVLHGFSQGKCEHCSTEIVTSHTPCDKVCQQCSEKLGVCVVCGEGDALVSYSYVVMDLSKSEEE
jgi:hypothetical protein